MINTAKSADIRMTPTTSDCRSLTGKVAVITGSTEGIGLAIARRLGQDGAKVMVSSRNREKVDKAVQELRAENLDVAGTVCHAGKAEDRSKLIQKTVSQFGGIDILVSSAGVNPISAMSPILNCPESAWDKIFDVNLKAAFMLCKEVVPHMEKRGGGSIIFISSFAGYEPTENLGPYSISKTAVFSLTKALVPQLSSLNIRVNCIAPGYIKTNFSSVLWSSEDTNEELMKRIPVRRIGEPREIAGLASFLSSEDASYITGETILVTGGFSCRL